MVALPTQNGASTPQDRRFGTLAVHAGAPHDPTTGAVIAPVSSHSSPDTAFTSTVHALISW